MWRELGSRFRSWPSTLLGVAAALANIVGQTAGCSVPLSSWRTWGPSALLLIWGVLTQGPPKPSTSPPVLGPRLFLVPFLLALSGCMAMPLGYGSASVSDQVKEIRAQGGSGCIYIRLSGTYPPFGNGSLLAVQAYDTTGSSEKPKLTFKDCLESVPEQLRTMMRGE